MLSRLRLSLFIIVFLALINYVSFANAMQVGIKYTVLPLNYKHRLAGDFRILAEDGIKNIMLAHNWRQWGKERGVLATDTIKAVHYALSVAQKEGIKIWLAVHCSFWGEKGNWGMPPWILKAPGYKDTRSVLLESNFRTDYINLLEAIFKEFSKEETLIGYNILNEPSMINKRLLKRRFRSDILRRWEGVVIIADEARKRLDSISPEKKLVFGNILPKDEKGVELMFSSKLYKQLDGIGIQCLTDKKLEFLSQIKEKFPDKPLIRTEGANYFKRTKEFGSVPRFYDYDGAYELEQVTAKFGFEVDFTWRISSFVQMKHFPGGLWKIAKYNERTPHYRKTPYYFALVDVARGVDSFEAVAATHLPKDRPAQSKLEPADLPPEISKFWRGTGSIKGIKDDLPPIKDTYGAASVTLSPGQRLERRIEAKNWADNINPAVISLWLKSESKGKVVAALLENKAVKWSKDISLPRPKWEQLKLSLDGTPVKNITHFALSNPSADTLVFKIDNIRSIEN